MQKRIFFALVMFAFGGCCATQERDALLLPGPNAPKTYPELVDRMRQQATLATEAFYTDSWQTVEEAALALEQSARFLTVTKEPPQPLKGKLGSQSELIKKAARSMRDAAHKQDVKGVNASLQVLHLHIRKLNPKKVP